MAWYRSGSISVTNGSTAVTGSGTAWIANVSAGESLYAPDGKQYEIASINSDTTLTLATAYLGSNQTGQSYFVIPTQSYLRDLAGQAAALVNSYSSYNTTSLVGKFNDGTLTSPGISFSSDQDTGFRRTGSGTFAITNNGTDTVSFAPTGATFTGDLSVSGKITAAINGAIGATTPNTGAFTTLTTTGNVTLGDAATDTVTVNGYMGLGIAPNSAIALNVQPSALSGSSQYGVVSTPVGTSAATGVVAAYNGQPATAAASFTVATMAHYRAGTVTKGAGSTITDLHGVLVNDQTQGTNNYGITSAVSSGTNKWNIYASGTAANYFAGNVLIGSASSTAPTRLTVATSTTGVVFSRTGDLGENADGALYFGNLSSGTGNVIASSGSGIIFRSGPVGTSAAAQPERLRIDSAGNVGIGTSSTAVRFHVSSIPNNTVAARFESTGTSVESLLDFKDPNTTANFKVRIGSRADALVAYAGGTERLRITSTGVLDVISGQIKFPATQNPSADANTLDDYEEGTFTPTIVGTSTAGYGTYSFAAGRYTKVGRVVNYVIYLLWTAHTGTGYMKVSGLPFVSDATATNVPPCVCNSDNLALTANNILLAHVDNGVATISLKQVPVGGGVISPVPIDTDATLVISGHYEV